MRSGKVRYRYRTYLVDNVDVISELAEVSENSVTALVLTHVVLNTEKRQQRWANNNGTSTLNTVPKVSSTVPTVLIINLFCALKMYGNSTGSML